MSRRKVMLPPFHGERMRAYEAVVREATERELDRWPVGAAFAVHPSMQAITLEVILRAVFGVSERGPLHDLLRDLLSMTISRELQFAVLFGRKKPLERLREMAREHRRAAAGGDRRAPRGPRATTSARCSSQARFEDGSAMSDREVRDQLMTLLLAGHETTATGLAWTLDLLTRNPDVLARARAGGDEYLRAVVAESLRLRPVVPLAGRRLVTDLVADGVHLPAGHRRHARDLARPHPPRRLPGPVRVPPGALPRQAPVDLHLDPVRRRRAPLPRRGVRRDGDAVVLGEILRRFDLRAASRRAERVARRNVTFSPRHGTRVIATRRLTSPAIARAGLSCQSREQSGSCCRSGHGCRRRRSRRAFSRPRPLRLPPRASRRCRSRCARTASTPARSTASTGPARAPACAASSAAHGLAADGIVGPRTRRALGAQGRHPIGSRPLRSGHRGWDVAALQFALETHGFPCGTVDGGFGARTASAVRAPAGLLRPARRRRRRPGHARRALAPAGPRPRAAQADRRPARRPLRPARQPVPRRPRLPRPHRHRDHRRRLRPRRSSPATTTAGA